MWSFLRSWRVLGSFPWALGLGLVAGLSGCGTDPVNPDGCKQIEYARCNAAPACPQFGADFDVKACKRFYRDQCLRGLQSVSDPGKPKIDTCTRAIKNAWECATQEQEPCPLESREINDPCALIATPEKFNECSFLDDGFESEDTSLSPFQDAAVVDESEAGEEDASEPDEGE
jgi:hypothetical protein